MKYQVSNVNEMRQAAEDIKTGKDKTYLLESAAGKRYILDFAKYDESVLPFWVVTGSHDEVENPYYVEPAPVAVDEVEQEPELELDIVEDVVEIAEVVAEQAPDLDESESDETVGLREEIEKLSAENERLRNENETLKQNIVEEVDEVSVPEMLEYVSLGDFIEFVAKHCKK